MSNPQFAVVKWNSVDDEELSEPTIEVVSSKYLTNCDGFVFMPHGGLTYKGKLDSLHSTVIKARNKCEFLKSQSCGRSKRLVKRPKVYSSSEEEEPEEEQDCHISKKKKKKQENFDDEDESPKARKNKSKKQETDSDDNFDETLPLDDSGYGTQIYQPNMERPSTQREIPNSLLEQAAVQEMAMKSLNRSRSKFAETPKDIEFENNSNKSSNTSSLFDPCNTSSPSSSSNLISRCELHRELKNYVTKNEYEELKNKYDRLKRKLKQRNSVEEEDESLSFDSLIKDMGTNGLYDATRVLMEHAYTEDEIINHTVSGKRANSTVTEVKPKFTPKRFNKIKAALEKKFPEVVTDKTLLTKKVTAVKKRLSLDKAKRESSMLEQ